MQASLREGSVVTAPDVAQTIDSPDVWKELRRDLEDVGISAAVVEENREYVLGWIKQAIQDGALDERCDPVTLPSSWPNSGHNNGVLLSDSGYGGSERSSSFGSGMIPCSGFNLSMANSVFEDELKRQRAEWACEEAGSREIGEGEEAPGLKLGSEAAPAPTVRVRRRTDPVVMFKKLFKNETDIIEAASDGDLDGVAKLVSLGMDVNARDRWGWSALSMCGYGGHKQIARLLLDHGANLDNVDVDGDTPSSLAAQRGHAQLVIMIDEERAARDLRIREQDTEVPRR